MEARVIARIWHGYTVPANADAYEALLRTKILPGIHRVNGYRGAYLLRRPADAEVEFITVTLWDSMETVREFAGPDKAHAVVPPEAQKLLAHYDQASLHYEATWCA
jgi:heme-degrading monooxygenase HmoA